MGITAKQLLALHFISTTFSYGVNSLLSMETFTCSIINREANTGTLSNINPSGTYEFALGF